MVVKFKLDVSRELGDHVLEANHPWMWVFVYPTRAEMRAVGMRDKLSDLSDAEAFVTPRWRINAEGENQFGNYGYCGVIRLHNETPIRTEILVHEMVHAAMAMYRRIKYGVAYFGTDMNVEDMVEEEKLAYLVGELTTRLVWKLQSLDLWESSNRAVEAPEEASGSAITQSESH